MQKSCGNGIPARVKFPGRIWRLNRLWVLGRESVRNGRRAGCRKAHVLEV